MASRLHYTLLLAVAAVLVTAPGPVAHGAGARQPADEVRGLWVLRTSMTSPAAIDQLVRTAASTGFNTLLVQVRGRGDAYYTSHVDPRAADLRDQPASFDPLALVIARAHAAGLKVHAWINVNLVSSAAAPATAPAHIVVRHPEWLMVPRPLAGELGRLDPRAPAYVSRLARWSRAQSDSLEGLFLSPIPEASQDYTVSVVTDLMRSYPLDGAHLDYIRYPSADFDYSRAALAAFRASAEGDVAPPERARLDQLATSNPMAWPDQFPERWTTFRRGRLTALVEKIRGAVKTERPDAILSSAVVPEPDRAREHNLQDWPAWAAAGTLDIVCPMAYATTTQAFAAQVSAATQAARTGVWMGIGAWRLSVRQTTTHLSTARRAGVDGVLLFSYDSLLTAGRPQGAYFGQISGALAGSGRDRRP